MTAQLPSPEGAPTDELAGTEQPFVTHLMELRDRLVYSVYGIGVALALLTFWPGPNRLMTLIAQPIRAHMPHDAKLIATGVFSPFFVPIKVLFISALLLAMPWVVYQLWRFVAPGLYKHERNFALPLIMLGSLLAYAGIAFVQFFVLEHMFAFIQSFTSDAINAMPDVASYVEAILSLYLAFAAAFQVPVVVILLVKMGMLSIAQLKSWRGYFVLTAAVVAAIITPPDALSMLAMLGSMVVLYELGIFLAQFFTPKAIDASGSDKAAP